MDGNTPTQLTVFEKVPVAPPPEATAGISLPLTFFDVIWLHQPPVHRLIFYKHPISITQFKDDFTPMFTNSLSLTLQHYSPLAGRLVITPDSSNLPEIRYVGGDTIPVVFAVSDSGEGHFRHLTSNNARSCTDFHPMVPALPPPSRGSDGSYLIPVLALQVTLFPQIGICIGVTNHHVIGDASSIFGFMKTWAFFSGHVDKDTSSHLPLPPEFQPLYDRTVVRIRETLATTFWDLMRNVKIEDSHVHRLPSITNKVRATFTLTRVDIQRLKSHVLSRRPNLLHVSTFTVICSYVWTCLIKSRNETDTDNKDDNFVCAADYRARLNPPVPENYFGNCIGPGCIVLAKTKQLVGDEEGFVTAAEMIGESIRSQFYNDDEDGPLRGAEGWNDLFKNLNFARTIGVAGTPKFDYYGLDFGWGKAEKFEMPSIDITGAISLSTAKGYEGGIEVGLALPSEHMDSFTSVFSDSLKAI